MRYRYALPLLASSDAWIDIGCGTGLAAREAVGHGRRPQRTLLVDRDERALATAARELAGTQLRVDLALAEDLERLEQHAQELAGAGSACITCFEVIEHLEEFGPLIAMLVRLAEDTGTTVVLSVPNDSFWSLHNPYHQTVWGGEAFEEFRRLLPDDSTVSHQLALHGSCIDSPGTKSAGSHLLSVAVRPEGVPTHYLVAFGASASALAPVARVEQLDLHARRAWERQRDTDLAWLRQREEDLLYYEQEAARLRKELEAMRTADAES